MSMKIFAPESLKKNLRLCLSSLAFFALIMTFLLMLYGADKILFQVLKTIPWTLSALFWLQSVRHEEQKAKEFNKYAAMSATIAALWEAASAFYEPIVLILERL